MFANSPAVVILGLLVGLPFIFLLFWAVKKGHFDHPELTSHVIFEEGELELARPWETPKQKKDRLAIYGQLAPANRDSWRQWL